MALEQHIKESHPDENKELLKDGMKTIAKLIMNQSMRKAEKYLEEHGFSEEEIEAIKKEKKEDDKNFN